jgi:hypothetical protein
MGPAGAAPGWFIRSNPELAEPFEASPEIHEFMVCVRRDTGRYAGYLELNHDRGEIGGIPAPDHRGQGLGAELFLAGLELPTATPVCRRYGRARRRRTSPAAAPWNAPASSTPPARPATPCRTAVSWTPSGISTRAPRRRARP